jgi:hypothetical protein
MKKVMRAFLCFFALWSALIIPARAQGWLPLIAPPASGCAESAAFLARVAAQDGTHTTAYQTMICGLVTDAVWSVLDVIQIYAAAEQATALTNLKSSSFGASKDADTTYTADQGFTAAANNGVVTGYTPSTAGGSFTQTSSSYFVWTQNSTNSAMQLSNCGVSSQTSIFPRFTDGHMYLDINSTADDPAGKATTAAAGLYGGTRNGTTLAYYQNGSNSLGTRTDTAAALSGGCVVGGQPSAYPGVSSAFIAGGLLDATKSLALYNRVHAYLQTIAGVP